MKRNSAPIIKVDENLITKTGLYKTTARETLFKLMFFRKQSAWQKRDLLTILGSGSLTMPGKKCSITQLLR